MIELLRSFVASELNNPSVPLAIPFRKGNALFLYFSLSMDT